MRVIKDIIGNTTVYIQTVDEELDVVGEMQRGRATQPTGIQDKITDVYTKLKSVLKGFAEDITSEVKDIDASKRPKELEIEFNLSLSAQAGVWILSGQENSTIRVRMNWDLKDGEKPNE